MRKSATVKRVTATPQPGEAAPLTGEIVSADPVPDAGGRARSGVQSLDRAFAILEIMADAGGVIGLSQLAAEAKLPLATIHRLVRTLVDLGYARQEPSRPYSLRPRLMRLAEARPQLRGTIAPPAMKPSRD